MMPVLSLTTPTLLTMPTAAVPTTADAGLFSAALLTVAQAESTPATEFTVADLSAPQTGTVPVSGRCPLHAEISADLGQSPSEESSALAVTDLLAQFPDDDVPHDIVATEMPEGVISISPTLVSFVALAGQRPTEPTPVPGRQPAQSAKGLTETRIAPMTIDAVPLQVSTTPMTQENTQPIKFPSTITAMPIDAQPIERHLDLARDSLWLDSLARDIVAAGDGGGRLSFRLSPPTLGALDVSITPRETGVAVAMTTSTEDAARIIGASTTRLVDDLRAQGLRVASADVTADNAQSQNRDHHRSQHDTPPSQFIETGFVSDDLASPQTAQPSGRFA